MFLLVLISWCICLGEEVTSEDNSASVKNLLNNEHRRNSNRENFSWLQSAILKAERPQIPLNFTHLIFKNYLFPPPS